MCKPRATKYSDNNFDRNSFCSHRVESLVYGTHDLSQLSTQNKVMFITSLMHLIDAMYKTQWDEHTSDCDPQIWVNDPAEIDIEDLENNDPRNNHINSNIEWVWPRENGDKPTACVDWKGMKQFKIDDVIYNVDDVKTITVSG